MPQLDRLRPGDLRDRITLQAPVHAPDGGGGQTLTGWATFAAPWAEVTPVSGGEAFKAGLANATEFYRVRIRYRDDVTRQHRIVLEDGTALNIRTCADPNRDREQLLIMAESGQADG